MEYRILVRLPSESKVYWEGQMIRFSDRFDPKKIKEVQFGKQDIRGSESITLINHKDCVPRQLHFDNRWEMLGFISGYNEAKRTDTDYLTQYTN